MILIDKCTHFLACYSVTVTVGICSAPEVGAASGLAVGCSKEAYDSRSGGSGWSWGDVIADVAGVAAGYVCLTVMRWTKLIS